MPMFEIPEPSHRPDVEGQQKLPYAEEEEIDDAIAEMSESEVVNNPLDNDDDQDLDEDEDVDLLLDDDMDDNEEEEEEE